MSKRRQFSCAVVFAVAVLAVAGCSSSTSGSNNDNDGGTGSSNSSSSSSSSSSGGKKTTTKSGGGTVKTDGGATVDDSPVGTDLTLVFSPMYSAYDGSHDFQVPAIVQGVKDVDWSARPADAVDLAPDSSTGGILITTRAAGDVQIIARAGVLSGSAMLHITAATPDDWKLGEERYNNMIAFPSIPDGGYQRGDAGTFDIMLPDNLSCRNCHGSEATALDVEHTPQQTAGYSDDDLVKIFTMGMKPAGAKFHTPFPPSLYAMFHTWDATAAEKKGIVVYLRSLSPKSQGTLDFGGLRSAFVGNNPAGGGGRGAGGMGGMGGSSGH